MARPTVAEINLSALRHNFRKIRSLVPNKTGIFAVVKADAYGHGAVAASFALEEEGAAMFGVATVEEGMELRRAGIKNPIIVLGGVDEPQAREAASSGLSAALFDFGQIAYLTKAATDRGKPFPVHMKVDTGMGRLGFLPGETAKMIEAVKSSGGLRAEGWMTHLSSADGPEREDREFTVGQLEEFSRGIASMRKAFGQGVAVHALNSAGIMSYPDYAFDMVRPGIALYGSLPSEGLGRELGLRPVMRLVSKIASVKELPEGHPVSYSRKYICKNKRTIAVVPIGYADGYRRTFSGKASMSVLGQRAPVTGRVCMDHTMIDVTGIRGVRPGTDVLIMGEGAETADALARISETIPYEILTQVGRRIPRRIVG